MLHNRHPLFASPDESTHQNKTQCTNGVNHSHKGSTNWVISWQSLTHFCRNILCSLRRKRSKQNTSHRETWAHERFKSAHAYVQFEQIYSTGEDIPERSWAFLPSKTYSEYSRTISCAELITIQETKSHFSSALSLLALGSPCHGNISLAHFRSQYSSRGPYGTSVVCALVRLQDRWELLGRVRKIHSTPAARRMERSIRGSRSAPIFGHLSCFCWWWQFKNVKNDGMEDVLLSGR